MKEFINKYTTLLFVFVLLTGSLAMATQAKTNTNPAKPTVVVIRADWCTACQKVEPIIKNLKKDYGSKMNFVVFDVTDEAAEAESAKRAKAMGLASFFNTNKRKTSTVAVFKGSNKVFHTVKNYNRSDYVNAFNKALG